MALLRCTLLHHLAVVMAVVGTLGCVSANNSTLPSCAEDGHTYNIAADEMTLGTLSTKDGNSCPTGTIASVRLVTDLPPPSLVMPYDEWMYILAANADPAVTGLMLQFTANAMCDETPVCYAAVTYAVKSTSPSSSSSDSSSSTTDPVTTSSPAPVGRCNALSILPVRAPPGYPIQGTLPADNLHGSTSCTAELLEYPSWGNIAIGVPDPMDYIFSASEEDVEVKIEYRIVCTEVTCQDSFIIEVREDSPSCPDVTVEKVRTGTNFTGSLETGTSCPSPEAYVTTVVRSCDGPGSLQLKGLNYKYTAPTMESDATCVIRVYCDGIPLCDKRMGFISLSDVPEQSTTTPPPVPPDPITTCSRDYNYSVPVGNSLQGTLYVDLHNATCTVTTYSLARDTSGYTGRVQLNLIGDFVYAAPDTQGVDVVHVNVYCITEFACRTQLVFAAYVPVKPNTTEEPGTPPPLPVCANVYYYVTNPGVVLSSSLNDKPGQDACAYGRRFTLVSPPQTGSLDLMPSGDFQYTPSRQQGNDGFQFQMHCLGKPYCEGQAYVRVSNELTLPPLPTLPGTTESPVVITNPQITCRGSCVDKAWKTYPRPPLWDNTNGAGYGRADGRPVDGLQVSASKHTLTFTVYTLIGNLGVRFPTFEPLKSIRGAYMEPDAYVGTIASSSPGFEMSCLAHQGREGMGEDVWKWTTLGFGTGNGTVGSRYRRGQSWYQKFGGKHVGCDTFADSCKYAPLLTPATTTPGGGRWTIDINDCDATWTGVFHYSSLDVMRKADGTPVFDFVADRQLKATLVSEAVRAHNWIQPGQFDTSYSAHDIIINLDQYLVVLKVGESKSLFSVDGDFYTYVSEDGNEAFGINMLIYPFVSESMTKSYAKDRHIVGFKWLYQAWDAPDNNQCPTCTGVAMKCEATGQYASQTYKGPFPVGNCPAGVGRVNLSKGPAMTITDCPADDMHVYNQTGFSAPRDCRTTFQNVTLRGVVPGSGALTQKQRRAFSYDGNITLELLLADETKRQITLQLSMYVSRMSQDSKTAPGGLMACRSGSYWPVLDPLGSSIPDRPYDLSLAATIPLCVDDLGSSFGPSDWVLFTLHLPGVRPADVAIHTIYLDYNNTRVFLYYTQPTTGKPMTPPAELGHWWQHTHPFLAFRQLTDRAMNGTLSASSTTSASDVMLNTTDAFIFIPGAIGVNTNVEVTVDAVISAADGTTSVTTFRHVLQIDPLLTQLSRQGPPAEKRNSVPDSSRSDLYAIGAIAGVTVALVVTVVFYMVADNNRPLPRWVPRGKLIKKTVLSMLPPHLRIKKKQKRIVHRDMYEAMNSGSY